MEALDILATILDLSQKGEEYSDEISSLRETCRTLQSTLIAIEESQIDKSQLEVIKKQLELARKLLSKCKGKANWWTNIKSLFPGSELNQIKDINEKLIKTGSLLNLTLNANYITKLKRSRVEFEKENKGITYIKMPRPKRPMIKTDEILETFNLMGPTLNDSITGEGDDKSAFSLQFFGDETLKQTAESEGMANIFVNYNQLPYELGRAQFAKFPKNVLGNISKIHCSFTVERTEKLGKTSRKKPPEIRISEEKKIELSPKPAGKIRKTSKEGEQSKEKPSLNNNGKNLRVPEEEKGELKSPKSEHSSGGFSVPSPINSQISSEAEEIFATAFETFDQKEYETADTQPNKYFITDSSTNGTFLNGTRIKKAAKTEIYEGDRIAIMLKKPALKDIIVGYIFQKPLQL